MKKINLNTLRNVAQYAPHRVYALILVGLAVLIPSIAIFAYGPDRATFTAENPATYVTFNSITNSPRYGDERNFALVKDAANASAGGFSDEVNVEDGKEYTIRTLVHNNARADLNLVANNTRVSVSVPSTTGTTATLQSKVSADNANPQKVWDEVVLKSDKRFNVAYVPGSAGFYNHDNLSQAFALPDSIVTDAGAAVGYNAMDGNVPGCDQFSGVAVFRVKIYGEKTPNFEMSKQVRKAGTAEWQKNVTVNPGDAVDYLVRYKNTGQTNQENVVVKDSLPAATTYKNGSTTLTNTTNPNGLAQPDGVTTPTGINVGGYGPGGAAYVKFGATIGKKEDLPQCGNNVLRNTATVETDNGKQQDYADVTVNKECENKASYSCDALEATKISELEYSFNVKTSSNMATAKEVTIDFGDGSNAVRDVKSLPVSHTYAAAGQYTIKAKASFDVNGTTVKDVTSDACATAINTAATPPAGVAGSAGTPTSIPSTGPVEVFAGILGASALGLGIQQWYASRRAMAEAMSHK